MEHRFKIIGFYLATYLLLAFLVSCRNTSSSDDNSEVENDESTIAPGKAGNNTGNNVDDNTLSDSSAVKMQD